MPIDYSSFDNIDVSDDEDEQAYKARKEAEEAGRRASKAQAKECVEAWWQACPRQSQFSVVECAARLTRAGTTSLYNTMNGPLKGLGLGFERPLTKDDALETVQGLLKYVALERVGLPGLTGVPEGWDVFGRPPASRIELDDDEGQTLASAPGTGPSSRRRCGRPRRGARGPRRELPRGPGHASAGHRSLPRPLRAAGDAAAETRARRLPHAGSTRI